MAFRRISPCRDEAVFWSELKPFEAPPMGDRYLGRPESAGFMSLIVR